MRITRTLLIAGVAVGAIAGVAVTAALNTHTLTLRMPDGGVERIVYTGDVAPRVEVAAPGAPVPIIWSGEAGFDDTAFAAMNLVSARMDHEMAGMLRQADVLEARAMAGSDAQTTASTASAPAGAQTFSFVSTMSGGGVCSRSVEITSTGENQTPRVVSHSSGNCGTEAVPTMSRSLGAAPAASPESARMMNTSYHQAAGKPSDNGHA